MEGRRQWFFRIHAWIGVNAALLIFLACLSGTIAVFSHELEWLADPVRRAAPSADADLHGFSWQRTVDAVENTFPDALVLRVRAPAGPRWSASVAIAPRRGDIRLVFVDPYSYEVKGQRSTFGIASFLRIFHKQFYLIPPVIGFHGVLIVGVIGLLVLTSSITGILSYRRWWRAFTRIRFGKSPRAFWSDVHRQFGVWSIVVSLLLSLTGVWYLAEYLLTAGDVIVEEPGRPKVEAEFIRDNSPSAVRIDLDRAAAIAVATVPGLEPGHAVLPVRSGDPLTFAGQAEAWVVRDRANQVHLVPTTGEVIDVRRGTDLGLFERWIETADPLHFGTFGGLGTQILWFVSGLGLCIGIVTGVYGVLLRQRRRGQRPAWRWRGAAALLPGAAVVLASAHGAWVYGVPQQTRTEHAIAYRPLGQLQAGPWELSAVWPIVDGRDSGSIVLRFPRGHYPNVAATAWTGTSAAPPPGTPPPRLFADRITVRVADSSAGCGMPCVLNVRLDAPGGARYTASMTLPGPDGTAVREVRHMPPAPPLPPGVVAVIAVFAMLALSPVALWARVLFRTRVTP